MKCNFFFILYSHFDSSAFTFIARFTELYVILFAHSYNVKSKEYNDKCIPTIVNQSFMINL